MKKVYASVCALGFLFACSKGGSHSEYLTPGPGASAKLLEEGYGGRPIAVTLSGAEEAPGPGDPDGTGHFTLTLNYGQGSASYQLSATNIATPTAAHIHIAAAGSPGPVVIPLAAPVSGSSSGVLSVDPELLKAILKNPSAYYVNVHNAEYPAGAIRAQLSK